MELDVTKSALRHIRKNYKGSGEVRWELEPRTWRGLRPDGAVFFGWSRGKSDMLHTVEAKVDSRDLLSSDKRSISQAVKQARGYPGNYRWLAVGVGAFDELSRGEQLQLKRDCRRTKHNVGLLICWKTKSDALVSPGYWPGYWLNRYEDEPWLGGWGD